MAADAQVHLRLQRAQQGGHGLAPAVGVARPGARSIPGRSGRRLHSRSRWPPAWQRSPPPPGRRPWYGLCSADEGVVAPGHRRSRSWSRPWSTGSFAAMACAGVSWCLAAEGHQHRARADGGVEALGPGPSWSSTFRSPTSALQFLRQACRSGTLQRRLRGLPARARRCASPRRWSSGTRGLMSHDDLAVPAACTRRGSAVTAATTVASRFSLLAAAMKLVRVLGRHHHGHALLALGDGQLGAVQARRTSWARRPGRWQGRRPARRWPRTRRPRRSRCSA